jgi:hypothetical protein
MNLKINIDAQVNENDAETLIDKLDELNVLLPINAKIDYSISENNIIVAKKHEKTGSNDYLSFLKEKCNETFERVEETKKLYNVGAAYGTAMSKFFMDLGHTAKNYFQSYNIIYYLGAAEPQPNVNHKKLKNHKNI